MKSPHLVYIVDDQALAREGLRALLRRHERFVLAGEAATCREAREGLQRKDMDLVLIDPALEGRTGNNCIRAMRTDRPRLAILALTMLQDAEDVYLTLSSGADGYLLKDASPVEMDLAMRAVLDGYGYLSPGVCGPVVREFLNSMKSRDNANVLGLLTQRELEVFHLVGQGRKNREVAELLFISIKTVEKHRASLMRKLGLGSARELRELWNNVRQY